MPAPSWLLLFWSGFAATLAAALFGTAVGRGAPRAWALTPHRRGPAAFAANLFAGVAAYPLAYGVIFELAARADVPFGLATGLVHATISLLVARPRADLARALRVAGSHLVYAVTIAFLYITP